MESITAWEQIPDFENEAAEALFWNDHELAPGLMRVSEHAPDSRE